MYTNIVIIFFYLIGTLVSFLAVYNLSYLDQILQLVLRECTLDPNTCASRLYGDYYFVIWSLLTTIIGISILVIRLIQHKRDTTANSRPTNQTKQ